MHLWEALAMSWASSHLTLQAQERRQLLEAEKLEKLAIKERKKADVQSKMREDRLAERQAREVLRPWLLLPVASLSS